MGFFRNLITILLTNDRHKNYEKEIKQANIQRAKSPVLGSQIKHSNEPDFSGSFKDW